MNVDGSSPGGPVAKKKTETPPAGDTLGSIAEGLGTLLGNAEKQWRAWQGPRDAVVQAVTEVRDRAVALLSEMDVAGLGSKGKKKGKKKKDKKAKKGDAQYAPKAKKSEKKAAKADEKAEKKAKKADKKRPSPPDAV
jgi:hypothetical protein